MTSNVKKLYNELSNNMRDKYVYLGCIAIC